jgi:hypothetical protein
VTEETGQTAPPLSSDSNASPYGAPLSSTTSAISASRLPDGCLGDTRSVCSTDVIAINLCPRCLISSAISTIPPLIPDCEAITNTSSGRGAAIS